MAIIKFKTNHSRILFLIILKNLKTIADLYPKMRRMARKPQNYTQEEHTGHIDKIVKKILKRSEIQIDVHGQENIPQEKGVLVCPNHQDKADMMVIWNTMPRPVGIVIDSFAAKRHFCRELCKMVPSVVMPKKSMRGQIKAIGELTEYLKQKKDFLVFPEGRYELDCKHLLPFLGGTFKSAMRTKAPIVPVAIINCNHIFDKGAKKPYIIQVHYLKPIFAEEYKDMNTIELAELVQSKIQEVVDKYQR